MFIEVNNLKKIYGKKNKVYALNGATFEIEKGEIVVILGPSGSGKSTLMNLIGGIDIATEGNIKIGDAEITKMKSSDLAEYRRKKIGFIFQTYNLISDLTAEENVKLITDVISEGISSDELFKDLGLEEYKKHFPNELSGGQQQRTAIARAMVKNPEILICDEPTAALDSKSSSEVLSLIEKINNNYNTTVIIVTHNEIISEMADRIIKLKDGKITDNIINQCKKSAVGLEF